MKAIEPLLKLVSFDPLRARNLPCVQHLKAENLSQHLGQLREADGILFPQYWQVNTLVFGLKKRIFPSLSTYLIGHSKIEMTRVFQTVCPDHVPQTLILANTPARREELLDTLSFPFVMKVPVSARGLGVALIEDTTDFEKYCATAEVLYAQEYLPIRRDLRVVFVGNQVLTAYWREGTAGSFLHNVAQGARLNFEGIPSGALRLVEKVARKLKVDHAGFDVAEVDGHFYLLEFNPLFGLAGLSMQEMDPADAILPYLLRKWTGRRPKNPPFTPPREDGRAA